MSIETMQLALEALDSCNWDYDNDENPYKTFDEDLVNDACEALRLAIIVENAIRELTTLHYEMQLKG